MELEIKTYTSPVLRQQASAVKRVTPRMEKLISDMFDIMYASKGIGLAAPQVGISKRIIVFDVSELIPECPPMAMINPVITKREGEEIGEEGCLSLPELYAVVKRAESIHVDGITLEGDKSPLLPPLSKGGRGGFECGGLISRVLQHEIDHLDGVLFIDRLDSEQKGLLREYARETDNKEAAKMLGNLKCE